MSEEFLPETPEKPQIVVGQKFPDPIGEGENQIFPSQFGDLTIVDPQYRDCRVRLRTKDKKVCVAVNLMGIVVEINQDSKGPRWM